MRDELTVALEWWTVPETALRWRISEDTVLRLIHDKELKARKFGRQWRIHNSAIAAYESAGKARRSAAVRHGEDPLGIYTEQTCKSK